MAIEKSKNTAKANKKVSIKRKPKAKAVATKKTPAKRKPKAKAVATKKTPAKGKPKAKAVVAKKRPVKRKPKSNASASAKSPFHIIGIGTSAGGLEALEQFFSNCPTETGLAFVIIQHLSPDYKSLMTELLSRHTRMKISEAKNKQQIEPNNIYLIPRNKNLKIEGGKLILAKRPPKAQLNFSIDIFFHSLAKEQKEKAIGVILSGTGSDGTRGGKSIKEVGGTIFVQSPDSGKFDGMPKSAISHGLGDYVLTPAEMPAELIQFVNNPHFAVAMMTGAELGKDIVSMDKVLKILKNHTGYDFFSYKKPTLLRRTAKRMNITKCDDIDAYIDYLYGNSEEKFILVEEFLIGVTKFFRDPASYEILQNQVIPDIVDTNHAKKQNIKIWVVACSTGEEAYSLAILFEEYIRKKKININYKIFATDIDGKAIDLAARGSYASNITLDVSAERLSKYFTRKEDRFQIKANIRKNIIFSKHDILQHPPFNKMDMVSCRNMLIYIDYPVQLKILSNLHYALNMNGYLFMGSAETIGALGEYFFEISGKWKIYRNIHPTKIVTLTNNRTWQVKSNTIKPSMSGVKSNTFDEKLSKLLSSTLVEEFDAVSICIDKNFNIIQVTGKIKKYIIIPEVGFTNNLLKLVPDTLSISISSAVRKLKKTMDKVIEKKSNIAIDDKLIQLKLIIKPVNIVLSEPTTYLITIIEQHASVLSPEEKVKQLDSNKSEETIGLIDEIDGLKEALIETKDNLQASIEELETSNEEMQATNEELLASNEELQSTNEELQSLNEELHTVNAELQDKNIQLIELNSDIENLMININIGTIFLDKHLNIRRFTPAIKEHFQLRDSDIGRPIKHFTTSMGAVNLVTEGENVLKTLNAYRAEFQNADGVWFILQIFPYRNQDDQIRGVVVNFININDQKLASQEKERLNTYISHLAESSPAILYVYDMDSKSNVYTSKSLFDLAGYTKKDIDALGPNFLEKIVHPDDFMKITKHHNSLFKLNNNELLFLEYRLIHKKTKEHIWILSTDKINERTGSGKVKTILGVAQNITEAKALEIQLEESEERSRLAIQGTGAALWEWTDIYNDKAWWSPEFYQLLGYLPHKMLSSYAAMLNLIHPDHVADFHNTLEDHLKHKAPFEKRLQLKTNKKGYRWFQINLQAQWNSKNVPQKVVGTLINIHEQYSVNELVKEKQDKLEAIYANAPVGIILASLKGKIIEASDGFTDILGYTKKEVVGKSLTSITHEEDRELTKKHFKDLVSRKVNSLQYDKRLITKSNKFIWSQMIVRSMLKTNGENYIIGILTNITTQKQAENKMRRLNEELERFAYLASHDLKEPLRTISSLTERLKEKHGKSLNKNAHRYIELIDKASASMVKLTSELLTYSQLGHTVEKYDNINLNTVVNKVKKSLETSIKENQVEFKVDKLPKIKGDKLQIELLFQNLISNSIKYRKKVNPIITIGYEDRGDMWEFFIKDNGIGIAKEFHDKIFEVFKRLHDTKKYTGTGIGLSNCKRVVDNHNGTIWVKSSLRRGATFLFTIPKKVK